MFTTSKTLRLAASALALSLASGTLAQAADLEGTLAKAKETGVIAIGFQEASLPFSYLDGDQKPVGYTLDICEKIVDAIRTEIGAPDLKIEYVSANSANRIPLVVNETIDLHCASATNNLERQKQVDFLNSHFVTASAFVSKKADAIKSIDDLKGRTVVSVSGSTNLNQLNKVNTERNLGINVVGVKDQLEAFMMLETDRADAYVMDDVQLATGAARTKDPSVYVISSETFSLPEPYGIIIRKNDPQLKAVANKATADLYRSEEMQKIYDKWFNSPIPPNGVNFNYPTPPALLQAWAHPSDSADPAAYAPK